MDHEALYWGAINDVRVLREVVYHDFLAQDRRILGVWPRRNERQPDRGRLEALSSLAAGWDGELATGIRPGLRFLIRHWPDIAPGMLISPIPGEDGARLTVTGIDHGDPVLAQVTDLRKPVGEFTPPLLSVLVARRLDPVGDPESTQAGQGLAKRGFTVRWNRAGVYALHGGPAHELITGETIREVAGALADVARQAPPGRPIAAPIPPARPYGAAPREVAELFLTALETNDGLMALAHADALLMAGLRIEPTVAELFGTIDAHRARPAGHGRGRRARGGDHQIHHFPGEFHDRRRSTITVEVIKRHDRWAVCGYRVANDLVLGIRAYED